jgi:hypothetical protein
MNGLSSFAASGSGSDGKTVRPTISYAAHAFSNAATIALLVDPLAALRTNQSVFMRSHIA